MLSKSQSAMEYLMTYGWSILVIAVVLGALFQLGIFSSSSFSSSTGCISATGYLCQSPTLSTNGLLTAQIGEVGGPVTITGLGCSNTGAPPTSFSSANIPLSSGATLTAGFSCTLPSNIIGTPFAGTLWVSYNTVPQTGLTAMIGKVNVPATTQYVPPSCANNWAGGYCTGSIAYTSSMALTSTVNVIGSITINGGVMLTTNGFPIIASGSIVNSGTITAGQSGLLVGIINNSNYRDGANVLTSYGGSGGGGAYSTVGYNPVLGTGGSTTVPGGAEGAQNSAGNPGSTASAPLLSLSLIQTWLSNGIQNYLEGATGGGGMFWTGNGGLGGTSSLGVYLQGSTVAAGNIVTSGGTGGNGLVPGDGGGGGGGGGSILIVYFASYTTGVITDGGGVGGTGNSVPNGGTGGSGILMTYQHP